MEVVSQLVAPLNFALTVTVYTWASRLFVVAANATVPVVTVPAVLVEDRVMRFKVVLEGVYEISKTMAPNLSA